MGFSADLDLAKGTGSSLSANGGKTDLDADYKGVGEQSGIFANQADLITEGKGTFKGGVFVTSKAAQDNGNSNIVFKQGVTATDLKNTTSYDGDAIQAGISIGSTNNKPQASMNGIGYGTDSDSDSSITKGGVSGYNDKEGLFTTDNREALAGQLDDVFDAETVNEELGAQTQITKDFGKEAPKAVGDYASNRQLDLINEGRVDEADKWAEGGAYRVALHTLVGAIATGSVEGALASGTTAVSVPVVDKYLEKQGVDETTRDALLLGLSAAAGAVVGGDTASTATSFSQTQNNYLSHTERADLALLKRLEVENNCSTGNSNSASCKNIERKIKKLEDIDIDIERNVEFTSEYRKCANGGDCERFYYLDVTQRKQWNKEAARSFNEHPNEWTAVPDLQNKFHNYSSNGKTILVNKDGSYNNTKYIHKSGQMEIVINKNGKVITDDTNAGTYNYYGPNPTFDNFSEPLGHAIYDVAPYLDFGNSASDKTSYNSRNPNNITINMLQKIGNTKLGEKSTNERNSIIKEFKKKGR